MTNIVYFNYEDIHHIFSTYINWNRNDAVKQIKELKEVLQEEEFIEQLSVYKKEFQIEILSYYLKNS